MQYDTFLIIMMLISAREYMCWDIGENWKKPTKHMSQEVIDTCCRNIETITELCSLMTNEELKEFINYDYLY